MNLRDRGLTQLIVLCPNHLAKQWQQEIEKVSKMKVALCSTINQLKAYSYDDFVNYDVIVFTYQLMQNPNYFYTGTTKSTYIKKRAAQIERPTWVNNQLKVRTSTRSPIRLMTNCYFLGCASCQRSHGEDLPSVGTLQVSQNCHGRGSRVHHSRVL